MSADDCSDEEDLDLKDGGLNPRNVKMMLESVKRLESVCAQLLQVIMT